LFKRAGQLSNNYLVLMAPGNLDPHGQAFGREVAWHAERRMPGDGDEATRLHPVNAGPRFLPNVAKSICLCVSLFKRLSNRVFSKVNPESSSGFEHQMPSGIYPGAHFFNSAQLPRALK